MRCVESDRYYRFERLGEEDLDAIIRAHLFRRSHGAELEIYKISSPGHNTNLLFEKFKSSRDARLALGNYAVEQFDAVPKPCWKAYIYEIYNTPSSFHRMSIQVKRFAGDNTWYWYASFMAPSIRESAKTPDMITFGTNVQTYPPGSYLMKDFIHDVGCKSRQAALKEALDHIRTTDNERVRKLLDKHKELIPEGVLQ